MRSKMPPCPGSRPPVSFTRAVRLNSDCSKSPITPSTPAMIPAAKKSAGAGWRPQSSSESAGHAHAMKAAIAPLANTPAIAPSRDLFGEMRGYSGLVCPFSALPTISAMASFAQLATSTVTETGAPYWGMWWYIRRALERPSTHAKPKYSRAKDRKLSVTGAAAMTESSRSENSRPCRCRSSSAAVSAALSVLSDSTRLRAVKAVFSSLFWNVRVKTTQKKK
mmetsp:Transcript_41262/g.127423  ORF Transcript_41262/g.127423 Transcript_41262/m.127423 type:complete len:222 (-) Transcript_41262:492-1157(-)